MPGRQREIPAVRPDFPRQRPDVIHRGRNSAPPAHDPLQQTPDQRIRSLAVLSGIFYAGHCGRGLVVLFSHKIQERATTVSRYTAALPATASRSRHALSYEPHARQSQTIATQALNVKQQL